MAGFIIDAVVECGSSLIFDLDKEELQIHALPSGENYISLYMFAETHVLLA